MYKTYALLALLSAGALSGCVNGGTGSVNANCATLGALGGAALGAATKNNIAQSAIVGGLAGVVAGNQGYCR